MFLSGAMGLIGSRVQQAAGLVGQLDAHNPAFAKGIAVAKLGGVFQSFVHGYHFARNGRNQIAGGLGAWLGAAIFDATGGYGPAFAVMCALSALAFALCLPLARIRAS